MRSVSFIAACLLLYSCHQHADKTATVAAASPSASIEEVKQDTAIEVIDANHIRLNGQLGRYFTLQQFRSVLGEPDSSHLLSEEEPCVTIFEEEDGSVDPDARYLYKNGTRYESVQGQVAIDEVKFADGDFIVYQTFTLNKSTTRSDLEKMFPNAAKFIRPSNDTLEVMQLRDDKDNISDGHVNIFLKDGKLYSLHWWFPC